MALPSLAKATSLKGVRVIVRVDFNVPIRKGKIEDTSRLDASLPTIRFLQERGAITILLTHIGRPQGRKSASLSTKPIAKALWHLLGSKVEWIPGVIEPKAKKAIAALQPGDVALLENVRFYKGEEKNDEKFIAALAELGDIFVLDGFAVAHRESASVTGLAQHLTSYAGLLLQKEIEGLSRAVTKPKKPFVLILGGAKIETKLPIVTHLLPKVNAVLLGGGIVNTCLLAAGYGVGVSLVDKGFTTEALALWKEKKALFPVDVVVGDAEGKRYHVVPIHAKPHQICGKGEAIFDVGPETIRSYSALMKEAQTLVWNGAMGYFEQKPYHTGTLAIARVMGAHSRGRAFGVAGGGETVQAMEMVKMAGELDLLSTGGGAMLEFLSGKELPGLVALGYYSK